MTAPVPAPAEARASRLDSLTTHEEQRLVATVTRELRQRLYQFKGMPLDQSTVAGITAVCSQYLDDIKAHRVPAYEGTNVRVEVDKGSGRVEVYLVDVDGRRLPAVREDV